MNLTWERRRLAGVVRSSGPNVEALPINRWKPRQILESASLVALWHWWRAKAPEDWRSPRRYRAIHRFRIPMRGIEVVRTFHKPSADQPTPDPKLCRSLVEVLGGFMVSMHA